MLLSPDQSLLFAVNPGDNSVSSFRVGENGKLTLLDAKRTGNLVTGRTGTAKSMAYASTSRTSIVSNTPDPDGLAVFPIGKGGRLGDPQFQDAGASGPWTPLFLNQRPSEFVLGYGAADGLALATLGSDGTVATGPVVPADTSIGRPSELCWMSITPDDRLVFATMTG